VIAPRRRLLVLLAVMLTTWMGEIPHARSASAQPSDRTVALVFVVPGVSFEQLMAVPEVRLLARGGGAALLANADRFHAPSTLVAPQAIVPPSGEVFETLDPRGPGGLAAVGDRIRLEVSSAPGLFGPFDRILILIVSDRPSTQMRAERDDLPPIVMAEGSLVDLAQPPSPFARSLTSDSTRRDGVVDGSDVQATIVQRLHAGPVPATGSPIRVVSAPAPFDLHERYLAMRRMVVPIETAAGVYVAIAALLGIGLLWRRRGPRWLVRAVAFAALSTSALVVALLAAGHLPTLSYATVVPFVVAVTVLGTSVFVPLGRRDALQVPAGIGVAVLAYFALEAMLGWSAALTTLHGGSELDGGRFYGLPNAFIGLLIGASVYVAHRLRPLFGFALVVGVGVFAGLPYVGSNLGGAVSLFAAAGIWLAIRERDPLGMWKRITIVAGTVVLGTALVLAAHRLAPEATHITRFEESSGGLAGAWSTFLDRLGVGWRLIERNPFGLIPVVGLFACLWLALRPPTPIREAFATYPSWRDVVVTIVLGGIVAYVANDSGAAACGMAFALGFGGLMYVSLTVAAAKMEPT
jgi:hypothetical protein